MIYKIQKSLGLEKLHPEVQYFMDYANLSIARPCSLIVMVVEIAAFINTFFYQINFLHENHHWKPVSFHSYYDNQDDRMMNMPTI